MVELRAAGRQPRGWEQVVARMNAITDLGALHQQVLELQCRVIAAQYGVLWQPGEQEVAPAAVWPPRIAQNGPEQNVMDTLQKAAAKGLETGLSQVLTASDSPDDPAANSAYIFVTILRRDSKPDAVVTAVAECRDDQVIAATAPLRELAAGLYEGYYARAEAQQKAEESRNIRQAVSLLASSQEAPGFSGACMNLVNELAQSYEAVRASVGWVKGRTIKLVAVSDADHIKRHSEQAALLEMAMAECLDQQQPIVWPLPDNAEPMLERAVIYSHKRLIEGATEKQAVSIPLRCREDVVGVITLERVGQEMSVDAVQRLQMTADVIAPQLDDRFNSDRWLTGHAWRITKKYASKLVGPRHVGWKLLGIGVLACLLYVSFGRWDYQISSPFQLEAHNKQFVSSIFEGRLKSVRVKPGDTVTAGQLLAELDTQALKLQRIDEQAKLIQATSERDAALSKGNQAEADQAEARMIQSQARIDLLNMQIEQGMIRSPMDAIVLAGDWHDQINSMVKQGDAMFEIAPLDRMTVVMRVDESDINRISRAFELAENESAALTGEMATAAEPNRALPLRVTRIVPMAYAEEGQNIFEVWCEMDGTEPWLRPGMEGTARIDMGRKSIAWILSHRIIDSVRLWLWK